MTKGTNGPVSAPAPSSEVTPPSAARCFSHVIFGILSDLGSSSWRVMSSAKLMSFELKRKDSRYRSGLEIAVDVLSIASLKSKKTRIMYQCNLSYRLIEKYLGSLLQRGLLMREDGANYVTTARGKKFLQMYMEYVERCRRISEDVDAARNDRLLLEGMCFNNERSPRRLSNSKEVIV